MTEKQFFNTIASPVGPLTLLSNGAALTGVYMEQHKGQFNLRAMARDSGALFAATEAQLRAYFAGDLTEFDLPLAPHGTEFQRRVWAELRRIPYGTTISYLELARRLGNEKAVRAVGAANGRNPLSIIIPCHRVVGANKSLTGYAGGIERKQILLDLETQKTQSGDRQP